VIYLLVAAWFGLATGLIGRIRGSSFLVWFIVGFVVPVIGLFVALAYRNERDEVRRQCPTCGRIYNLLFKPPKRAGVCDVEGARLIRRADDSVDVVSARLEAYEKQTSPIMVHYAGGDYHSIPANRPPGEIFRDIETILKRRRNGSARKPQ